MQQQDEQLGRRLGQLVLEQRLGRRVYHAVHLQQRRSLAVKLLTPLEYADEAAVQEFSRELLFLRTLEHPGLVSYFGGGVTDLQPYLAMELVDGCPLETLIKRQGQLAWEVAAEIIVQACDALEYANHRGLMHGRLAPDKVLISSDHVVKIADFRRPRGRIGIPDEDRRTLQSLTYRSPEQICGKPPASHRSDVYSLGCLLFEMLCGRPPFAANSLHEMSQAHLSQNPPRVSTLVMHCPVWLDALVAQMLEKSPERRPQFASAVAEALREAREKTTSGVGAFEHALSSGPSAIQSPQGRQEAKRLLGKKKKPQHKPIHERLWFLCACLLLTVLAAVWAFWPPGEKKLFLKAEELAAGDSYQQLEAKRYYLEPLLRRFPDGQYAAQAQALLDKIEAAEARDRIRRHRMTGTDPKTEGERLFLAAQKFELFGDRATALAKYRRLIEKVGGDDEKERAYGKLAQQHIAAIEEQPGDIQSAEEFLQSKLDQADAMHEQEGYVAARKTWLDIFQLYADEEPLAELAQQAHARLFGPEKD